VNACLTKRKHAAVEGVSYVTEATTLSGAGGTIETGGRSSDV
jgi:hypothetical protein